MEVDPLWNLMVLLHGLGAYCKSTAARTPARTSLADAARPPKRESHTPPRRHTRASSTAVAPTNSNRGPSGRHHLARHLNNVLICEPLHRRWLARMIRRRRNVHGLRVDPSRLGRGKPPPPAHRSSCQASDIELPGQLPCAPPPLAPHLPALACHLVGTHSCPPGGPSGRR